MIQTLQWFLLYFKVAGFSTQLCQCNSFDEPEHFCLLFDSDWLISLYLVVGGESGQFEFPGTFDADQQQIVLKSEAGKSKRWFSDFFWVDLTN